MTASLFQLKTTESLRDGIARVVGVQLAIVGKQARADDTSRARRRADTGSVHNVRRCFKRVRAALRLVRDGLDPDLYRKENACFRDAARPLTEIRDSEVLPETVAKLERRPAGAIDATALATLRETLLATPPHQDQARALIRAEEVAALAFLRLPHWTIEGDAWSVLEGGLRRIYRNGRRARASAVKHSSAKTLHEWRKHAMYLWHELELLEVIWTAGERKLTDRTHKLSRLLGEDHDLAVLRATIATDPGGHGGKRAIHRVIRLIDHRRADLERRAFALGRKLYHDSPKRFIRRIEADCASRIRDRW